MFCYIGVQLAVNANRFFMVSHMGVSQCKMADEPDLLQRVIGPAVDLRRIESGRCDADGLQQRGDLLLRGEVARDKEEAAAVQLQGNFHKAFKRKKVGQRASGTD